MEIDSENVAQPVKVWPPRERAGAIPVALRTRLPFDATRVCVSCNHKHAATALPSPARQAPKAKASKPAAGGGGKTIEETYQKLSQVRGLCCCWESKWRSLGAAACMDMMHVVHPHGCTLPSLRARWRKCNAARPRCISVHWWSWVHQSLHCCTRPAPLPCSLPFCLLDAPQLEHILLRPDTYIGSTEAQEQQLWVHDGERMVLKNIRFVPGLYKIFDEILVNAADNKV